MLSGEFKVFRLDRIHALIDMDTVQELKPSNRSAMCRFKNYFIEWPGYFTRYDDEKVIPAYTIFFPVNRGIEVSSWLSAMIDLLWRAEGQIVRSKDFKEQRRERS